MGSARHKLNVATVNGALIIAALIGIVTGTWPAFWAVLVLMLAGGIYAGNIRPRADRR